GNPQNGPTCTIGPKCATVKVRRLPDRTGVPRKICSGGFLWHSQNITTSGTYRENFRENNCCPFDSVVQFTVLPDPKIPEVYFISCDNKPFVDNMGRSYPLCNFHNYFSLPASTDKYKCDSGFILTSASLDFVPNWKAKCANSKVELVP